MRGQRGILPIIGGVIVAVAFGAIVTAGYFLGPEKPYKAEVEKPKAAQVQQQQ